MAEVKIGDKVYELNRNVSPSLTVDDNVRSEYSMSPDYMRSSFCGTIDDDDDEAEAESESEVKTEE